MRRLKSPDRIPCRDAIGAGCFLTLVSFITSLRNSELDASCDFRCGAQLIRSLSVCSKKLAALKGPQYNENSVVHLNSLNRHLVPHFIDDATALQVQELATKAPDINIIHETA